MVASVLQIARYLSYQWFAGKFMWPSRAVIFGDETHRRDQLLDVSLFDG